MAEVGAIVTGPEAGAHLAFCRVCGWRAEGKRERYDLAAAEARSHICPADSIDHPLVGIDPALGNTGVVMLFADGSGGSHTVKSPPLGRADRDPHTWSSRIERTAAQIAGIIPENALVAIEGPAYAAKWGNPDERAGLRWSLIARLRVKFARVVVIPPTAAKMWLTDNGAAGKTEMITAAAELAPSGLKIKGEHEADAFALVSMLAAQVGRPIFEPRPRGTDALAKVAWEHLKGNTAK